MHNRQAQSHPDEKIRLAQVLVYGIYGRAVELKTRDIKDAAYTAIEECLEKYGQEEIETSNDPQIQIAFLKDAVQGFARQVLKNLNENTGNKERNKKSQAHVKLISDKANEIKGIKIYHAEQKEWYAQQCESNPQRTIAQRVHGQQEYQAEDYTECLTKFGRIFATSEHICTAYFVIINHKTNNKKTPTNESQNQQEEQTPTRRYIYPLHQTSPAFRLANEKQRNADE